MSLRHLLETPGAIGHTTVNMVNRAAFVGTPAARHGKPVIFIVAPVAGQDRLDVVAGGIVVEDVDAHRVTSQSM